MALTDFKPQFDLAYEEIFQKTLVAKEIANMRFEPTLKYGESVERVLPDISGVVVRSVTRGSASTIDSITDSSELLNINLEKEAVFHLSDGEVKQAGPMNPGEYLGAKIGHLVSQDFDARFFAEVLNANQDFDNGDLTTLASTGTPITLSSTTVPQMAARMPAKLARTNNQNTIINMVLVVDAYAASDIAQYLLGKNIDLAESVFANGYTGPVSNAKMYVSENLTGSAVLGLATQPTDGDTVTINGVVFTFKTVLGVTAGNVLIGASADTANTNLAALINAPGTTTAQGVALSAADQATIAQTLKLAATADTAANTMTVVGTGSGRLTVAETLTDAGDVWSKNMIHCYFGKRGAIDAVLQDMKPVEMRPTADRRGTNVFSYYLGGIKTFTDGSKKFLDVLIAV